MCTLIGWKGPRHILSSKENLHFDNITKGTVFPCFTYFFTGYFYQENSKHLLPSSYEDTRVSLWETAVGTLAFALVFQSRFLVLPNFHSCSI